MFDVREYKAIYPVSFLVSNLSCRDKNLCYSSLFCLKAFLSQKELLQGDIQAILSFGMLLDSYIVYIWSD